MRALVALAAVGSTIVVAAACGEDYKDCYQQDLIACTCPNGAPGYAKCTPAGNYEGAACVCDGTTPGLDAGHDAGPACVHDAGIDAASLKKNFEACATADECAGCRCESFQDAALCTQACATNADCPPESGACNARGVCRAPQ